MRNKCKWHSSFRNSKWACVSTTLCAFGDLSIEMFKISVSENGLRGEYITTLGKIFHYQLGFLLKHTLQFPCLCALWSWLSVQPSLLSTFNIGVCGKWERETCVLCPGFFHICSSAGMGRKLFVNSSCVVKQSKESCF